MRIIVITQPYFYEEEAALINRLFNSGLTTLHLRKPLSSFADMVALLRSIESCHYSKIVLHDHFDLLMSFPLKGVHLNSRNPICNYEELHSISTSCHSLSELSVLTPKYDYLFLSPIFDSISKTGYKAAFNTEELTQAKKVGIINEKVIALGGVTRVRLPQIEQMGFGGAAVLGDVWAHIDAYCKLFHSSSYH
jgi:thiamine-phosphate pyrophosphorylase